MWYIWLPFSYVAENIALKDGWGYLETLQREVSLIRVDDYTTIGYLPLVF